MKGVKLTAAFQLVFPGQVPMSNYSGEVVPYLSQLCSKGDGITHCRGIRDQG